MKNCKILTVIPCVDTLCRLMPSELPETIDPMRLAKTGKELSGSYDLCQFNRVNTLLEDNSKGKVSFKLEFSRDDKNQLFSIVGGLETTLDQICQRCMQPMQHQLSAMIRMAIVSNEVEAEMLPAEFEAYIDTGVPVNLQGFIEDELLLALPLVSLHEISQDEEQECPAANKFKHEQRVKENPFAKLKEFKIK
ncbi:MAG: YceD family protein [Gammaproteobacteria bacterium]